MLARMSFKYKSNLDNQILFTLVDKLYTIKLKRVETCGYFLLRNSRVFVCRQPLGVTLTTRRGYGLCFIVETRALWHARLLEGVKLLTSDY